MGSCKVHWVWCHDLPRVNDGSCSLGFLECEDTMWSWGKTLPLCLKERPHLIISFLSSQKHLTQSSSHSRCSKNALNIWNMKKSSWFLLLESNLDYKTIAPTGQTINWSLLLEHGDSGRTAFLAPLVNKV